jgi:hypothetical protein
MIYGLSKIQKAGYVKNMRLLGKEKRQKVLKSKGGKIVKRYNFLRM